MKPTAYARNVANDCPAARTLYGSPLLRMLWDAADGSPAEVSDALLASWGRFRTLEEMYGADGTAAAVHWILQCAEAFGDARACRYVRRVARIVRRILAAESAAAWAARAVAMRRGRPAPIPGLIPLH